MTVEEEEKLKTYLVRTDAISAEAEEAEFDAWCQDRYESKEGEAEFKAVLAEAKAYALGCSDVLLQKEIMASTYDRILKNLAEVLMSERHRADRPPPGPMGIPSDRRDHDRAQKMPKWRRSALPWMLAMARLPNKKCGG